MKITKIAKLGVFLGGAMLAQGTQAITLSTIASATNLQVGDNFQVDLVVSGLHDLGVFPNNEIVSAFDLGVGFDNAVIQANSITIAGLVTPLGDSWLGDGFFDSLRDLNLNFDFINAKPGDLYTGPAYSQAVELSEVSFLLPVDLQSVQPDTFLLGSIFFSAIGLGNSDLGIIDDRSYTGTSGLLDVKGLDGINPLTTILDNSRVSVSAASVPEPAITGLLSLSLISFLGFSRKKRVL